MSTIAHLTLAQYDRMIEAAVFDQREQLRLELIRGEIRKMNPIGPLHSEVVNRLVEWSYAHVVQRGIRVRTQDAIGIPSQESAPEPDVFWLRARDYSHGRPRAEDVLLVIEVADASLAYDTGEKAELYAAASIGDYWVVNVADRSIEVRRDPANGRYRSLQTFSGSDEVRPLSLPEVALRPVALWEG